MTAPSDKALLRWWAHVETEYGRDARWTCLDCGREDHGAYVQPQHPFYAAPQADGRPSARCGECIGRRNAEARAAWRAARDAEPRCEVPGCRQPRTWKVGGGVWLCGRHKTKAQRGHAREAGALGGLALFLPMAYDRADVLRWAQGREEYSS